MGLPCENNQQIEDKARRPVGGAEGREEQEVPRDKTSRGDESAGQHRELRYDGAQYSGDRWVTGDDSAEVDIRFKVLSG